MEGAQARLFETPYLAQGASGDGREHRPDLCRTDDAPGRWRWRGAARVARPDPGRHADRRRRRRWRVRHPAMPRGHCGARCNTVDPATRWCCALVEAYARRRLAQRRDRCHRPKQPAELEEDVWISPALAGRDADVPLEGAHRQEPGGAHNWSPGHRGSHPRGRAQSHDLAGTPSVRPYRVNSWGEGKFPGETRFMQQRPIASQNLRPCGEYVAASASSSKASPNSLWEKYSSKAPNLLSSEEKFTTISKLALRSHSSVILHCSSSSELAIIYFPTAFIERLLLAVSACCPISTTFLWSASQQPPQLANPCGCQAKY